MRNRFAILLVPCLLAWNVAHAGTFQVTPTRVDLSTAHKTAILGVKNNGADAIRFQVSTFVWAQGRDGEMQLAPTSDVVVYPTIFTIAPGKTQVLRIGTLSTSAASELSYRIFVEELPPLARPETVGAGIKVLTRIGIPIFLAATTQPKRVPGAITHATQDHQAITFSVENHGVAHVVLTKIRIIGHDAHAAELFQHEVPGWYLLAGGIRDYSLPVESCARLHDVVIEVTSDAGVWSAQTGIIAETCGAGK